MRTFRPQEGTLRRSFSMLSDSADLSDRVPAMVTDMVNSPMTSLNIENVMFGGAIPPEQLPGRVRTAFPNAVLFVAQVSS